MNERGPVFHLMRVYGMIVITRKKRNSSINRLHSTVRRQELLLLIDSNQMKNECRVYIT
jgi:hypothetical protein